MKEMAKYAILHVERKPKGTTILYFIVKNSDFWYT